MKSPIVYKMIPTQYGFYVHKDGKLNIIQLSDIPKEMKFKSEAEARKFIKNFKKQL